VEPRGPKQAITRARRIDADSFTAFDPDWGPAYCRRIVHIEARGGTIVAEDIRLADTESREQAVARIALECVGLKTLKRRGRDALNFQDLAIWNIRDALQAAWDAGAEGRAS
jgi:hypothetical protein